MATTEGELDWSAGRTWYRVIGSLDAGRAAPIPAVVLHGGPGASHDYVEPIADLLSASGRPCVLYDQLGCGRSQHLPHAPSDFWTPQLFKDELRNLLQHLGIADRYAVVGQSWGGMLGMEHALDRPAGLKALVVADSPASMTLWVEEANRLRAELPSEVEATLQRHEDPTVYHTMNGPSEFHVIGSLAGWDITDRLGEIDVPTLLVSGAYDEATPRIVGDIHGRIAGSRWELFPWSSHMPHVEEPAHFRDVVDAFLSEIDAADTQT